MERINVSIGFDQRLAVQDIAGSKAHAAMLARQGIIGKDDASRIIEGLDRIANEIADGGFTFKTELEDIHMNVEARLAELIGEPAGRLHTARSRNDQVATDFRLWVRDAGPARRRAEGPAVGHDRPCGTAHRHGDARFTHLQTAQPVTFGHHLLAYVEMLGRDRGRMRDARARLNECPLGSAALAGTSFRSTATAWRRRWASTGPRPIRWTPCPTGISRWNISAPRRSARSTSRASRRRSWSGAATPSASSG